MADDWRVHFTLAGEEQARAVSDRLSDPGGEHGLATGFDHRVIVSRDGHELFLYASEREQAQRAAKVVVDLAGEGAAAPKLTRWHPDAQEWADADVPLPQDERAAAGEHARLVERERHEAAERGFAGFEIHVECAGRRDASELAERLRGEGLDCTQRWRYLLIGAADEDAAAALARRIAAELPRDASLSVGASVKELLSEAPQNPFSVLGGLGG